VVRLPLQVNLDKKTLYLGYVLVESSIYMRDFQGVRSCMDRPSHNRMQLTCTAQVSPLKLAKVDGAKIYSSCQKHESLSLHARLSNGRYNFGADFTTKLKPNVRTTLTTWNITVFYCCTKRDCTSAQCIFNCNKLVTGHK